MKISIIISGILAIILSIFTGIVKDQILPGFKDKPWIPWIVLAVTFILSLWVSTYIQKTKKEKAAINKNEPEQSKVNSSAQDGVLDMKRNEIKSSEVDVSAQAGTVKMEGNKITDKSKVTVRVN